jgi:hypothetical protein
MVSLNNLRLNVFNKIVQCIFIWDFGPKQFSILHKCCVKTIGHCATVTLSCSGASQNAMLIAQHKWYKLLLHDIPTLWARRSNVRNDYELFIVKVPSASWNSTPLFSFTHKHATKVSQQVFSILSLKVLNSNPSIHTIPTESIVFMFPVTLILPIL